MGLTGAVEAYAAANLVREQGRRFANPGPALQAAAAELDALIDESFAAGRSPGGARWARQKAVRGSVRVRARRPSTVRRDGSHPILQRTGALRSSVTVTVVDRRIVGSISVPYAIFIQSGTRYMRARPIAPLSKRGNPYRRGPAGDWLRAFIDGQARYILTGSVS